MLMRKNVIYDVNKVSPIYKLENKNDLSTSVGEEEKRVQIYITSKIQLVVYYQCCVLIG